MIVKGAEINLNDKRGHNKQIRTVLRLKLEYIVFYNGDRKRDPILSEKWYESLYLISAPTHYILSPHVLT